MNGIEIIAALLILLIAYCYFMNKKKYIELPTVQEDFKNVHVFKFAELN